MRQNYTITSKFTPPGIQGNRFPLLLLLLLTFLFSQNTFAQGVGIGTTDPDPSASLHIFSHNKGILIPKVQINNKADKVNVPNPANTLLVYNLNPGMYAGAGFYFNNGTPASPDWRSISQWYLPYEGIGAEDQLLNFENYSANNNSSTLRLTSPQGYALKTVGKLQISGPSQSPAAGKVLTSDASGNATWQGAIAFRIKGISQAGAKLKGGQSSKVSFTTEEYDLGNNFKNINETPFNTFTAPVVGIYHFDTSAAFDGGGSFEHLTVYLQLKLLRNGAETLLASSVVSIAEFETGTCVISTDVKLEPNDQVFVGVTGGYASDHSDEYFYIQSSTNGSNLGDPFFNGRLETKL